MPLLRQRLLLIGLVGLTLLPVVRLLMEWQAYRQLAMLAPQATYRSFDWIDWREQDGAIVAAHVFAGSPAHRAGVRAGDVFFKLAYRQFFSVDDLRSVIEGMEPGSMPLLQVIREGKPLAFEITVTRYPVFLYPLNAALWQTSRWGFALAAFLHLLALILVVPLVMRSRSARFSLALILASGTWIGTNLLRMILITLWGPVVGETGLYAGIWQGLTVLGLIGWVLFPALLLHQVLLHAPTFTRDRTGRKLLYLPALVLGGLGLIGLLGDPVGPFSPEALTAPLLFYTSVYVAVTMGMYLLLRDRRGAFPELRWSQTGSLVIFAVAALGALMVLGLVPVPGVVTESAAGWFVVGLQLLSVAPVGLLSYATLMHGHTHRLMRLLFAYLSVGGIFFFGFVGGMALLKHLFAGAQVSLEVMAALYGVGLLWLIERGYHHLGPRVRRFFLTEREEIRQRFAAFVREMPGLLSPEALVEALATVMGEAFEARSVVVAFRYDGRWVWGGYRRYPPYASAHYLEALVQAFHQPESIWTASGTLGEVRLPSHTPVWIREQVALIVPVRKEGVVEGLFFMGYRKYRQRVYNLDDVDMLRALGTQVVLALERLRLIDRERQLVQESSQAQLVALRAQINPHFLFNAFNTLSALILEAPEEADRVLTHLAGIFRHVLQTEDRALIPLEEELALVEHYLAIEQIRFRERLHVEIEVPEEHRRLPVPAFCLQTLVENAVKHGIGRTRRGGTVHIRSTLADDELRLEVLDTGAGVPPERQGIAVEELAGIGLRNVCTRLRYLYERDDLLTFESRTGKGTRVELIIPCTTSNLREHGLAHAHRG